MSAYRNTLPPEPNKDFDRYDYVDRDIYSSTAPGRTSGNRPARRPENRRPEKKKSGAKKFFLAVLCVVLILALAGGGLFLILSGRTNAETVDTEQYKEIPEEAPAWDVMTNKNVTNILLLGADSNSDGSNGRSDTMMLMSINKKDKKIRLVSFLRDTYLNIPTVGGERLNTAIVYGGAALTMQTIENYFRVNIDQYVLTDFEKFESMIDQMDGIDVEISEYEADFINATSAFYVTPGMNHLNGAEALYFARIRKLDSDFGRTSRQRQVVTAMLQKLKSLNAVNMASVVYDYLPYVTHNLSEGEMLSLLALGVNFSDYEVESMYIPADGTYYDDTVTIGGIEGNMVLQIDVEENARLLREFLYGTS